MNDSDQPVPASPSEQPTADVGPPPEQPPQPRGPRPVGPPREGPRRQFPRGERPKSDGSKPQDLTPRDFAGARPSTRDLDREIEAEMAAALQGFDVSGTVARAETTSRGVQPPGPAARKRGRIIGIHGKDVFVDVPGGRSQGVLPIQQFEGKSPVVGDEVEFDIEGYDAANGLLRLTREGSAQVVTDWSSVSRGMIVEAKVTGVNKNRTGLLVEVNGIKGFMPISQIDMYRVEKPEDYLNQKIKCMIAELDPSERNLVLSRRALLEQEREKIREEFWAAVEVGQVKTGIVRSVKPFGAFVDLGGADGLIPISELSWSRVGDPSEVVQVGQKVEVKVSRVDYEARKIALSLRQLVRSPWDDFAEQHRAGARLVGKVTRIADFGAFVEVAPGIEGLVHISELSTQRVRRVRDVLSEGQEVTVQVQSIDPEARRMSLSLKAMKAEAEAADAAADEAEREEDRKSAEERMAQRAANPNLRGGIGTGRVQFDKGE
ncbi:MAG TPA: S1 RNA-binding domain-containing protein [Fimbriiglobus sp.]|nr:S1 RNA-binding domain-containing protein [Fimbriiglobus sp.]